MMGFCSAGDHDECPGKYQRFIIDAKNRLVWLDEYRECNCKCHAK